MLEDFSRPVVGFAGCGSMGAPMACRLRDAGYPVWGFDVRPRAAFGELAPLMIEDPREFAQRCDVVVSVVRDAEQTLDLCFRRQALFEGGCRVATLVLSSTLPPRVVHEVRARLDPGVDLVDAPMSGAPVGAREGSLTFMAGGEDPVLDRLHPVFAVLGRDIRRCGGLGSGMTVKVLNNYVAVACVVAVRRVLDASVGLGVAPQQLREVMCSSSGSSWFGNNFDRIDWSREGYAPGNTIGILEKDLAAAREALADCDFGDRELLDQALADALRKLPPFVAD